MSYPVFPLALQAELEINGAWTDVTPWMDHGPLTIGRGHPDESTTLAPSTLGMTLTNGDYRFSPDATTGAYYPYLVPNVPCRASVPAAANYLRLEAGNSDRAYVNQVSALNITGSIEMRIQLAITHWAASILAAKWDGGGAYHWQMEDDGSLTFSWFDGSAVQHTVQSTVPVRPTCSTQALRVQMNAANGNVSFWTAPTIDGTYTLLGAINGATGGAATSIQAVTSPLVVGWSANSPQMQLHGRVDEFRLYNGLTGAGGTAVADAVFSTVTAGAASWTDTAGRSWLLGGGAEVSSRDYRAHVEISEFPEEQPPVDPDTGVIPSLLVQAVGGGLLRRLNQRNTPARSTLYRAWTLTGSNLVDYWPMEDGPSSQSLASAIGRQPMYYSGSPQLASNSDFKCSDALPVSNEATFSGKVQPYSGTWSGNQVSWLMEVPQGGEFNTAEIARIATSGTIAGVVIRYGTGGSMAPFFYAQDGTLLGGGSPVAFAVDGQALLCWVSLAPDGAGGINWEIATVLPDATTASAATGNIASATLGAVTRVALGGGAQLTSTVFGHVAVQAAAGDLTALGGPLNAWLLERAGDRIQRICQEEGITFRSRGVLANTAVMGIQTSQTVSQIIQEAVDADRGTWTELRSEGLGWGYVPRSALYNQAVAVGLDYSRDQLGPWPAQPTKDDAPIANDVTVSQAQGGSSARAYAAPGQPVDGGRLSTLAPPAGVGTYDGGGASLNLANADDLPQTASWMVRAGTVDEHRLPGIEVDLANAGLGAALAEQVAALDLAQRLTIASVPGYLGPDAAGQLAAQLAEEIWTDRHIIRVCGIPSSPYDVAQEGSSLIGSGSTTLAADPGTGGTTLELAYGLQWSTSAPPLDLRVGSLGPERVTCTAIGPTSRGGVGTKFGAWLDTVPLGSSDWSSSVTAWNALMSAAGVSVPLSAGRWYKSGTPGGPGDFTLTTSMSQMISGGYRMLLTLRPAYSPVSSSDKASMASLLSTMQGLGADVIVTLWHEPALSGLSSSQYTAMVQYYGPTVRQYFPLYCVFSGSDAIESNGYLSGIEGQVDGIAADCYGVSTDNLDNCMAMADAHGVPLGLWEFNVAFDCGDLTSPVTSVTQAQNQAFLNYIVALFQYRIAAGRPCGDVMLFNGTGSSTGTSNFLGSWSSQNGGFEGGKGNWIAGSLSSVAPSSAQAHSGTGSLAVTCSGGGTSTVLSCSSANVTTQGLAVTAGQSAIATGWWRAAATPRSTRVSLQWFNGTTALTTVDGTLVTDSTSGWTFVLVVAGPAPSGTTNARLIASIAAASASEVHYLDDPQLSVLPASTDHTAPAQYPFDWRLPYYAAIQSALNGTSMPQKMTVTRSVNGVVRSHPAGTPVGLWTRPVAAL